LAALRLFKKKLNDLAHELETVKEMGG
jgi:hypothetical protein